MVYGWVTEKVCNYNNPVDVLTAEAPGDALELEFDGSLLAISTIAGMDAGALEIIIDGVELPVYDLFDNYCKQFHRPVFHVLAHSLPEGKHTAQLRVAGVRHADSTGHAVRILNFAVA
jgi:hypothetical protein